MLESFYYTEKPLTFDRDVIGFISSGCSEKATEDRAYALAYERFGITTKQDQREFRRFIETLCKDSFKSGYATGSGELMHEICGYTVNKNWGDEKMTIAKGDGNVHKLSIYKLHVTTLKQLKKRSQDSGLSASEIIRRAVITYLATGGVNEN